MKYTMPLPSAAESFCAITLFQEMYRLSSSVPHFQLRYIM
uniref:Uncharacterized protein n=1 Tax=Arundo donax TaxID=35708 RepID=A0A0A9A2L5_ARUDO